MKESDAKTKLCPFIKEYHQVNDIVAQELQKCRGSDCMVWEYNHVEELREISETDEIPEGWEKKQGARKAGNIIINRWVHNDCGECGMKPVSCHAYECQMS